MEDKLRGKLNEEINTQFDNLSYLESGSDEKASAVKDLATLYQLKMDESRLDMEKKEKENESKCTVKERFIKIGIAAAEIILPLIFYSSWMKKGFEFEKEGTFTSSTFRSLINKFKPTKK